MSCSWRARETKPLGEASAPLSPSLADVPPPLASSFVSSNASGALLERRDDVGLGHQVTRALRHAAPSVVSQLPLCGQQRG